MINEALAEVFNGVRVAEAFKNGSLYINDYKKVNSVKEANNENEQRLIGFYVEKDGSFGSKHTFYDPKETAITFEEGTNSAFWWASSLHDHAQQPDKLCLVWI